MIILKQYSKRFSVEGLKQWALRGFCCLMVTAAIASGLSISYMPSAMAVGSDAAADVVNSRAAAELDRVSGEGTSDQLGGAIKETTGKAKRGVGRMTGKMDDSAGNKLDSTARRLDGATDELGGKIQSDVGRAKRAASDAGDDAEDAAGGFVESVKDFFN